jgi:hypothetical protein
MIRITVEMVPKGDEDASYTLAQAIIVNDVSGSQDCGNYTYGFTGQVKRRGQRDPAITRSGRLLGFKRKSRDVWDLIHDCLDQGDQDLVLDDGTGFRNA